MVSTKIRNILLFIRLFSLITRKLLGQKIIIITIKYSYMTDFIERYYYIFIVAIVRFLA